MAYTAEIEKLERRWKEHPKGTFFAPYAEVLRKNGDYALAKEVLRQGLEIHPNHIPGNIVLGRCCLDLNDDAGAEQAFSHVIELDAENVIALKALADVTERHGRFDESAYWLERLITVDPSNEEAREQIGRVQATREQTVLAEPQALADEASAPELMPADLPAEELPAAPPEPLLPEEVETVPLIPTLRSEMPVTAAAPPPVPDMLVEPTADDAPEPMETGALEGLESAQLDLARDTDALESATLDGMTFEEDALVAGFQSTPAGDFHTMEQDQAAMVLPPAHVLDEPPVADEPDLVHIEDEPAEEIVLRPSGLSEFHVSDDSGDLLRPAGSASEFQTADAAEEMLSLQPQAEYQGSPASEELAPHAATGSDFQSFDDSQPSEPEPVVPDDAPIEMALESAASETESPSPRKSELRLIYPDEAAAPEPQPQRRISATEPAEASTAPGMEDEIQDTGAAEPDFMVTETMAELYVRQGHSEAALRVYRQLLERSPADPRLQEKVSSLEDARPAAAREGTGAHGYAASVTGGQSVEAFFQAIAAAPLGELSRDKAARPPEQETVLEGEPASETELNGAPGAPTRPARDPLSLSAIFGEESSPTPPAVAPPAEPSAQPSSYDQFFSGKPATPPGSQSTRTSRSSLEEDLDQFQNWLKSLKR